jgi:hypothetical protein
MEAPHTPLAPWAATTNGLKKDGIMSEMGKTHIVIMWTVGPDDVAEGDHLFESRAKWMTGHAHEGKTALRSWTGVAPGRSPPSSRPGSGCDTASCRACRRDAVAGTDVTACGPSARNLMFIVLTDRVPCCPVTNSEGHHHPSRLRRAAAASTTGLAPLVPRTHATAAARPRGA